MEASPKSQIALTQTDKMLKMTGLVVLATLWILSIWSFFILPEIIPTHFNVNGKVDEFGGKATILFLPIIGTIIYFGTSYISKYPQFFNFPVQLTPENRERQYANALRMISCLKISFVIIFMLIVFQIIQTAQGKSDGFGLWFLPLTLALVFIPLAYFIAKSLRNR